MALEKQCDDLCMLINAGVTQAEMAISVVAEKLTQSYSLCITPQVEAVEALLAKHCILICRSRCSQNGSYSCGCQGKKE